MNATDILVMPVASYFVNMYFLGCLRSLFSFLTSSGRYSIHSFVSKENLTYNLAIIYDYLIYNFYSEISEINLDSTGWSAIKVAIGRVESGIIPDSDINDSLSLVKAIGLLNIFGTSGSTFDKDSLRTYASHALGINNPNVVIAQLESAKIIRYATYKSQYILFEGTDVNIESEILRAAVIVPVPIASVEELKDYVTPRIASASAAFYRKGTPRYFEFILLNEPEIKRPEGDIDGYCELIFPLDDSCKEAVIAQSAANEHANIYAVFNNVDEIVGHLHEIKKLQYLLETVAIDDIVAKREITNIQDFEKNKLNSALNDYLFAGDGYVTWYFHGQEVQIRSKRDFNHLLSDVCEVIYPKTPAIKNELFNKQKLSSAISLAKSNLLDAILEHSGEQDLGFPKDAFPPEKTIYLSLLKNTGIHRLDEDGFYSFGRPTDPEVQEFWDACGDFVAKTVGRPRKVSDLIKLLSSSPFKLKQGFIDFWIPIYLFIRQQDYALYGSNGNYVMNINRELFDLLWKHPADFSIKAFSVEGIKLEFFRKYRQFLRQDDSVALDKGTFANTFKPFLYFYKNLNEYAKTTHKFNNSNVAKFRDVLANAVDPEKVFFEDLPEALGYKGDSLTRDDEFIQDYLDRIREAVRELNACYPELIKRIESRLVDQMGLPAEYSQYKPVLNARYSNVKKHLLTQKARTFLDRVLAPAETNQEFIERISSAILDKQLYKIKDKEEEALIDNIIFLFYELDRYSGISEINDAQSDDRLYSFGLLNNAGVNERQKMYRLPKSQQTIALKKKEELEKILSGDLNLDICILLEVLADKIK